MTQRNELRMQKIKIRRFTVDKVVHKNGAIEMLNVTTRKCVFRFRLLRSPSPLLGG